jgi:hypothetical protein
MSDPFGLPVELLDPILDLAYSIDLKIDDVHGERPTGSFPVFTPPGTTMAPAATHLWHEPRGGGAWLRLILRPRGCTTLRCLLEIGFRRCGRRLEIGRGVVGATTDMKSVPC